METLLHDQVQRYADLGIAELVGWSAPQLAERATALASQVIGAPGLGAAAVDPTTGRLPVVLVLPGLPVEKVMPLTLEGAGVGLTNMFPVGPDAFTPVVPVPTEPYLLLDLDTGRDTLGVPPSEAGPLLEGRGRLAITIAEGVSALVLHPGLLRAASCFQMLASRDGSRRIPSLWVTKQGNPRLGWCWDGNPHSWLGAASAAARVG